MDKEKTLAIKLADNEKRVRTRALAQLRNYIQTKSAKNDPFNEQDLIKLWKGLHYCMWMADKPLIQQELSERISSLMSYFNNSDEQVILFIEVYFKTIIREWNGIDKWRIDKFMMMMRDMIRSSLAYLKSKKWNKILVNKFNKILVQLPLNINEDSFPDGVSFHVADIYLEELAKFGDGLKPIKSVRMIQPFVKLLAISKKRHFVEHIKKKVFDQIIECSDVGIDPEEEKQMAELKAFGLQTGEPEDTSEYSLKFNYEAIANRLFKMANSKDCLDRNKKTMHDLVSKFRALAKNVYPIDDFNLPPLDDKPRKRRKQKNNKKSTSG